LPVISCGVSPAFRTTTLANPWLAIIGVLHNPQRVRSSIPASSASVTPASSQCPPPSSTRLNPSLVPSLVRTDIARRVDLATALTASNDRDEARWQNAASRCRLSRSVIRRDRQGGRHSEGGRHVPMSRPLEIRGSPDLREVGGCLPRRCLRSLGKGGRAGMRTGRTPCLPACLLDWVPVTLCDSKLSRSGTRGAHPPGPWTSLRHRLTESLCSPESAVEGVEGRTSTRGLPPLPCRSGPVTWGLMRANRVGRGRLRPGGCRWVSTRGARMPVWSSG
jgi:hypothetical protein